MFVKSNYFQCMFRALLEKIVRFEASLLLSEGIWKVWKYKVQKEYLTELMHTAQKMILVKHRSEVPRKYIFKCYHNCSQHVNVPIYTIHQSF